MKKIVFILAAVALSANLAFGYSQEQINEMDEKCESGDLKICLELDKVYYDGNDGFKKDENKAKRYYEKVCTRSNVKKDESFQRACTRLAYMYDSDAGDTKDFKKSLEYRSIACDARHEVSCVYLGVLLQELRKDGFIK